jgi:hypothetical protein
MMSSVAYCAFQARCQVDVPWCLTPLRGQATIGKASRTKHRKRLSKPQQQARILLSSAVLSQGL